MFRIRKRVLIPLLVGKYNQRWSRLVARNSRSLHIQNNRCATNADWKTLLWNALTQSLSLKFKSFTSLVKGQGICQSILKQWLLRLSASLQSAFVAQNQFSTSLFVSLFVHWEPQQIFMGVNTEYRASLVKGRVNVPIILLHLYWVCQESYF